MALTPAMQALLKNARNKYQSRGAAKVIKPKEGKTRIRVLPGPTPEDLFYADLGVHWIKASATGKPLAVVGCHEKVHDQPCAICSAIETAIQSATDTETENLYKSWRSRKSGLMNVIVRDGPDKSDLAQIMEVPATVMEKIIGNIQTYADDDIWALDENTGVDFVVERRGKGFDTEYSVTVPPKSVPVTQAQLDSRHDLAAHIEREHFRGEDQKALNAIAQITGVTANLNTTALSNGRATQAALTSSVAQGAEDFEQEDVQFEVEAPKPRAAAPVAPAAKPKPVVIEADDAEDLDALLAAELDGIEV